MAITQAALIQEGARVRVRRADAPIDPAAVGRTGIVVDASEYRPYSYGVQLDGDDAARMFAPAELEILAQDKLPPERQQAKQRRALP